MPGLNGLTRAKSSHNRFDLSSALPNRLVDENVFPMEAWPIRLACSHRRSTAVETNKVRRWLLGLVCASYSLSGLCADGSDFWQSTYPHLREPTADSRPKVRTRADQKNIEALAAASFGGAEIGIDFRADPTSVRAALRALLETSRRVGLHVDLAPGGGQPYVSPGVELKDSMQQLVSEAATVSGPMQYEWTPRQPSRLAGEATLVAVSAARIVTEAAAPVVLDAKSAIDLTAKLDSRGVLHWHIPAGRWLLFSYWQRATGQIMAGNPFVTPEAWSAQVPGKDQAAYLTADIFSAKGISAALAYLDQNLLSDDAALLRGGDLAHDSLEVQAEMFWTGDLPTEFHRRRGYSHIPYLPALNTPKESSFNPLDPSWGGALPVRPYEFNGEVGERVRYDYAQTLTDLYCDRYLNAFARWAHGKGMRTRVQVAYNYFALDMLRSARAVDIAENESFDSGWSKPFDASIPTYGTDRWRHAMDSYRLTGSAMHLAGRSRATIEFGDDFAIYRKQPVDYVQQLNEALAGGITQGLLTAFSSADTAWPVPQGLAHIGLGDEWSAAWPQWRDWQRLTSYFARATQLLESGTPRADVAIYHDRGLATVHDDAPLFADATLEGHGYTYDFVDPAALSAPEAGEIDGMLFGRRVGYRALLLDHEASIPAAAAQAILTLARRGLTVVIVGDAPSKSSGFANHEVNDQRVKTSMAALLKLPNVARITSRADVAAALRDLGCAPAASFGADSPLLSIRRQQDTHDLWWIFNPTNETVSVEASLSAVGAPYIIDLWSGHTERLAQWKQQNRQTLLPLKIMPHQSIAVLIRRDEAAPLHALPSPGVQVLQEGDDFMVIATSPQSLKFSNGLSRDIDPRSRPLPVAAARWHLHVDEQLPEGARTHELDLNELMDWRQIPALKDAVGSALYAAEVSLPPEWFGADRGILLSVGEVHGAMQLMVNDHLVTEQTTGHGQWLVGAWLKPGVNSLTVRLDTTLLNRMVALRASGDGRYQTGPTALTSAPSGLLGPVILSSVARLTAPF
jgi:alpha-L-rhamnosidase